MPQDDNAVKILKSAPLSFMKSSLFRAPSTQTGVYGRPVDLTFVRLDPGGATATHNGQAVGVYAIREARGNEASFKSYICDFSSNDISYQVLSAEADFCFTFAMDGCTFGVGSSGSSGDVLVSHGNSASSAKRQGGDSQLLSQRSYAQQMHGGDLAQILEPTTYRPGKEKVATTFGLRTSAGWQFYYNSYQVVSKKFPPGYEFFGVFDFQGNAV